MGRHILSEHPSSPILQRAWAIEKVFAHPRALFGAGRITPVEAVIAAAEELAAYIKNGVTE